MNKVKDERRECYGKYGNRWKFLGWYPPQGTWIKSTKDFDFYEESNGSICKYRKPNN